MRRRFRHGVPIGAAMLCLVVLGGTLAQAAPRNGGFESGDFSRWFRDSNGDGHWDVYSGPGAFGLAPPPRGEFAAQTVQDGPSSNILYRALRLRKDVRYRLSMQVYYVNDAGAFVTPRRLSKALARGQNQQYRIDLMKPNSPLRSLEPEDVLMNIFRTRVGDPLTMTPNLISANLSRFAGRTVRLRIAEVDNQGNFAAGVDAVTLKRR